MDSYAGVLNDPITLHKYLYANANPVMNTDPSGYLSATELVGGLAIASILVIAYSSFASMNLHRSLKKMALINEANETIRYNSFSIILVEVIGIKLFLEMSAKEVEDIAEDKYVKEYKKEDDDTKRNYFVYTLVDKDGIVRYVGRTKDYNRRMAAHKYNGKIKQHTNVGDDVFIGCNSNIIAPVTIGNGVYICAGTTVTKDIEEKAFVIGRSKEEIKRNRENPYTN